MAGAVVAGWIAGEIALYTVDGEVVSLTTPFYLADASPCARLGWILQRGARASLPRRA